MCVCVSGGGGGAGLGTGGAGEAKESPLPPLCIAEGGASSQAALCVAWRTEPGFQVDLPSSPSCLTTWYLWDSRQVSLPL